jgi:peptidoglycan/LPS O-acetylase OafA/YrhL
MLKNFHQPLWQRITRHGQRWLLIGAAAVAVQFYCVVQYYEIEGHGYGFFETAAGYSLNAIAFAFLVVAALSPNSWLARIRIPGAYHLALWSYSTYLSHKPVQIVLARSLKPFNLPSPALASIILITALLVGSLLYYLVEAPFMAWRDRSVPSNFANPGASVPISSPH